MKTRPTHLRLLHLMALAAFLCFGANLASAELANPRETWTAANEAYQARRYAEARDLYEQLAAQGMHSPDLYLNLGNAYYQLGQKGMAAWMYEKALSLAPRDPDARHNLQLSRPFRETPASGASFIFWPFAWLYSRFTANEWAIALEAAYLLSAILAFCWILAGAGAFRRWARLFTLLCVAALIIVAAFAVPRAVSAQTVQYGVVVQRGAVVRSAPGPSEPEYFESREGEKFEVSESEVRGWMRVKRPSDGRTGYLPETVMRKI